MKKYYFLFVFFTILFAGYSFAQDVSAYKVPSEVMTAFQKQFPEAKDVDWELNNGNYEVDFELGWWGYDHEILFAPTGQILKHKAEISKKELPESVSNMLDKDFRWYWIRDVKRITEGHDTIYTLEARSLFKEWELTVREDGTILSKFVG